MPSLPFFLVDYTFVCLLPIYQSVGRTFLSIFATLTWKTGCSFKSESMLVCIKTIIMCWNVNIFTHFGSFCETSRHFDLSSSRSLGHVIFSRETAQEAGAGGRSGAAGSLVHGSLMGYFTWPRLLDERSKRREVSQNDPKWVKIFTFQYHEYWIQ